MPITLFLAPLLGLLAGAPTAPSRGQLTYLANEGFLIAAGETRVLVDALHRGAVQGYPKLPPAMQEDLEAARGAFAGVDLVLVTHHHGDHFDPEAVSRHLLANPSARLVSTPQVVERLRREFPSFPQIAERLSAVLPAEGERREQPLGTPGLALTVLNLHHGRGLDPPVENLGFLIELGGVRFLHVGDTEAGEADWARLDLTRQRVDVALLPYWLLWDEAGRERIRRQIAPRGIVPMHWPSADAPASWFDTDQSLEGLLARMGKLERVVVMSMAGEERSFAELLR